MGNFLNNIRVSIVVLVELLHTYCEESAYTRGGRKGCWRGAAINLTTAKLLLRMQKKDRKSSICCNVSKLFEISLNVHSMALRSM